MNSTEVPAGSAAPIVRRRLHPAAPGGMRLVLPLSDVASYRPLFLGRIRWNPFPFAQDHE